MSFPNGVYAPPGVYTTTKYDNPTRGLLEGLRLPVLIGTGSEILSQANLEMIRGSSQVVDQRIVQEDETGRAVVSVSMAGAVTLGDFDGVRTRIQTRKYPIVNGRGSGTTSTKTSDVQVTVNGQPIVVTAMSAEQGLLTLAVAPELGDEVRVSYYFKRTDTLTTDDLSDQVTEDGAIIYGAVGQSYTIVADENDTLVLTVDDTTTVTVTIPSSGNSTWTAAQVAAFILAAAGSTSLSATTAVNNFGQTVVALSADGNLTVGSGSANSTLGFTTGDATSRNRVFYTFQGPIVDGTNGGVTTTDPTDVTVLVDGVAVVPVSVDGATRAVTLPAAPASGSTVTVEYYFNSWQDTFDYLMHTDVTEITSCGVSPTRSDYTDQVDFVLKDDRIVWGTSVLISAGEHTAEATYFNDAQVSATLVDTRCYLQRTSAVVDTSVSPPRESRTQFVLSRVPTTGNGRNSPLGASLFQTVSNDRIDLPTNRPDLVLAYWGFGVQDAIERGAVTVTAVDSATSTITLKDPVPVGATVYATYYYNTLTDQEYTLTTVVSGASGVGTYSVKDESGTALLTPTYGTKSSGLSTITLQFPSGSERKPDVRFEVPSSTTYYDGPVAEDVTVTFASTDSTLAKYAVPGAGDYELVLDASDHVRIKVDGADLAAGATGIPLDAVIAGVANLGFPASLIGDEVEYSASYGYAGYDIDSTNDGVNLLVDGVLVSATAGSGTDLDLDNFVTAINTAASAAHPQWAASGKFLSSVTITVNEYDQLRFHYTGSFSNTSGNLVATITPGTYASVALLAAEIQTQIATAVAALVGGAAQFDGLVVAVTANGEGQLVFTLTRATADDSGYLEFITHGTPARDFAVLAGIDTAAATAGRQVKVVDGPIARRFSVAGDNTSALLYDRLLLRSRIVPGFGTVYPFVTLANTGIVVQGSTGDDLTGLVAQTTAEAGWSATVLGATLLGTVGFSGGQVASGTFSDLRDGQPSVTFYAASGTTAQNNVFKFTMDGVPVTVTFTDASGAAIASGGSADVPLGPASSANTVLGQIRAAITAAGISTAASRCVQEGAAIRLYSALSSTASSIVIGTGNANATLGFNDGDVSERTLVTPKVLASALMGYANNSVFRTLNQWDSPSTSYFGGVALAGVVTDEGGAEYLYLQSQGEAGLGTSSSIAFAAPTADSVLLPTTGLGVVAGDGASGEAGITGFYVTSSDPANGSGTANTSVLNSGTGQDGIVGQTYVDLVTGLTFTVLAREGGADYPASEYFTFKVRTNVTTDSNLPVNTIPGLELLVTNTLGVPAGDTAVVETFERGGEEPGIGDTYYVSYQYVKQDYDTALFTRFATIESVYGTLSPDNPVTLAAYLAMLNGAVLVGIKQVQKDTDDNGDGINDSASVTAFRDAVDELEGPLEGGILPDILIPLRGDNTAFFQYITRHADIQSDMRHQAERTIIAGVSSGTTPRTVGTVAQSVQRDRFRLVYPDIVIVPLPQADGQDEETLVDGTYLASMLAGSVVSPNTDVATPWTHRRLQGALRLARTLDAVEMNQVAVKGVTVIEDRPPVLRVRHGLTTDMVGASTEGNANLSKLPTIKQIVDEVQQQSRKTLDRFIGTKFLPGVLSQIEGQLSNTLKLLVQAQILAAYTGVKANIAADNPTVAEVEAFVQPVFPLLYIVVTFNMRSKLV